MQRLIVCCDGTWKTADHESPTNIVKLRRAIRPSDDRGVAQVVFYDEGVGTGDILDRIKGAFGAGLSRNVRDGYSFLVDNYEPGDEIYLFGYSRGAFTARSIAGLIRKCGLLQKTHGGRLDEAYSLYRRRDSSPDSDDAKQFRSSYARRIGDFADDPHGVRIRCIGVFDTVGSLGVPAGIFRSLTKHRYEFHDVQLSSRVEHGFHALAIDEERRFFEPALWTTRPGAKQIVEQVWFAGVHADVGGGAPVSTASDCALLWMILRTSIACGIAYDPALVGQLRFTSLATLHESRTGIYAWLPALHRAIGTTDSEAIHFTAEDRYKLVRTYRPPMLQAYFDRRPAIVATDGARIPIAPPAAVVTPSITPKRPAAPAPTASARGPARS